MQNRRRQPSEITPEIEDTGLFTTEVGEFAIELVPQISRSSRNDLIVRGFVKKNIAISVVFAGRRTKEAPPVEARLKTLLSQASRAAAVSKKPAPDLDSIRLPIRVEGSWRPRFERDESGWEKRSYQLLASRWGFIDHDGMTSLGGKPPTA